MNELGAGAFFGEEGIATGRPRNAHVIARDGVTCLVFSPGEPTDFAGRGEEAHYLSEERQVTPQRISATTCIDVSDNITQKIAAIASYRTQYPITPDMFPINIFTDLMGREYFMRIDPPVEMEATLI